MRNPQPGMTSGAFSRQSGRSHSAQAGADQDEAICALRPHEMDSAARIVYKPGQQVSVNRIRPTSSPWVGERQQALWRNGLRQRGPPLLTVAHD